MKTLDEYLAEVDSRFRREDVRIAACCENCYKPISILGNPDRKPQYCECGSATSPEEVKAAFRQSHRASSKKNYDPVDTVIHVAKQK